MSQALVDEEGQNRAAQVPRPLDLPDPGRSFTPAQMSKKLSVLFIVSQPTSSPAIAVHANLMRSFDPGRVEVHVAYNALADAEPYCSSGTSVRDLFPAGPNIHLRPTRFGPVAVGSRRRLLSSAVRSAVPGLRDCVALVRYVRRNEIDVIHCEKGPRNGFYAYCLSRLSPAKYAMHFHWKYGSYLSSLSRFSIKKADAIIPVSSWTGRAIQAAGVPAERIFPVLNGIDSSTWDPEAVEGDGVRREFSVDPDRVLVVMVAQLVAWKRQAVVVEAFRRVVSARPGTRLLLVGVEIAPPTAPGSVSYTEELRRLVAEAGLENSVTLTGQRRDIRQVLAAADIFVLPSVDDPCALAHIEAMAMAKPIVTVSAGGAPELVEHGKAGLVGPVDDSDQLAENIIALIDDPAARRELGDYGRRRALDYLNAQRMSDEVEAVYRLLATGGAD